MVTRSGGELREFLIAALQADLIGPFQSTSNTEVASEVLPLSPSRWYLTGFLAPVNARELQDPTADEETGGGSETETEEGTVNEPEAKQKKRFPASMGLTVLLPFKSSSDGLEAIVTFADYAPEERRDESPESKTKRVWRRVAHAPIRLPLELDSTKLERGIPLPDTNGIQLKGKLEGLDDEVQGLPRGTRVLSLFVVNHREPLAKDVEDARFAFQVGLELRFAGGFLPRSNRKDEQGRDWDDRVADLQYRKRCEFAVGHNVSVEVAARQDGLVTAVRTTWMPRAEVLKVKTRDVANVELRMRSLAALNADSVAISLGTLPERYREWIAHQRQRTDDIDTEDRRATRDQLMLAADAACARIATGIRKLGSDPDLLEAFRFANQAMLRYAERRGVTEPRWRLFQLAFVLMTLTNVARDEDPSRDIVDLIYFPTGGGKTEAYLGLVAFTLLFRRLSAQRRADEGLGVAVLLRYTLRLLTLDQLGRAATLICALERLRQEHPVRLGTRRFAIGLWGGTQRNREYTEGGAGANQRLQNRHRTFAVPAQQVPMVQQRALSR